MAMKRYPASIKLPEEAYRALQELKQKPGGFNLNRFVADMLISLQKTGEVKWPEDINDSKKENMEIKEVS